MIPYPKSALSRYKLTLAYDGSAYAGWQIQPGHHTIQGELEKALGTLSGQTVKVHGSGRTDQGVHAIGQVAHVDLPSSLSPRELSKALHALLPPDIRLLKAVRVAGNFHARRSAVSKEYRYFIWNDEVVSPFLHRYRTHIRSPLNVQAMQTAAATLVGRHDFASFTANPNRKVENTIRHLSVLSVRRRGKEIILTARSDGFLYKMVRSLVGLLIRIGEGTVPPSEARAILVSRKRTARVPTAPPKGLFLWRVDY